MAGEFAGFPAALVPMLQTGYLEREGRDGLMSILGYRMLAVQEPVQAGIGETITKTRYGRKAPNTTPLTGSTINSNLDNGMTPATFSIEQFALTLKNYGDTADVNLLQQLAGIFRQLGVVSKNSMIQAAQTMDRLARFEIFAAYCGGNSRVRTALGTSNTTSCFLDDVTGFEKVMVNGVLKDVSGTNTIAATATKASDGSTVALVITAVAVDSTNKSSRPDGKSGQITFNAIGSGLSNGDTIIVNNAPKMFRPYGRLNTAQLVGSDVLNLALCEDVVAYLRDQGTPPMDDGNYWMLLDNTSMRQLFADPDFKNLYTGQYKSEAWKSGQVVELAGIRFIPTTEAYVQQAAPTVGAVQATELVVRVRRPIVVGADALIQGTFEGLETFAALQAGFGVHEIMIIDDVAQIVRPPLDRLGQNISVSWTTVTGFSVPSDTTATNSIIPTAGSAQYKRAAVIEHAG